MKTFFETIDDESLNEGFFDRILSMFTSISNFFSKPDEVERKVNDAIEDLGDEKTGKFIPSKIKPGDTCAVQMGDETDDTKKFTMTLTKMADLPNKSFLFQMTGTTNSEMLMSLVKTKNNQDLMKNNIMVIVSSDEFQKGKPMNMIILKNALGPGKSYETENVLLGTLYSYDFQNVMKKNV